jgi:hypothetical protein
MDKTDGEHMAAYGRLVDAVFEMITDDGVPHGQQVERGKALAAAMLSADYGLESTPNVDTFSFIVGAAVREGMLKAGGDVDLR